MLFKQYGSSWEMTLLSHILDLTEVGQKTVEAKRNVPSGNFKVFSPLNLKWLGHQ